MKLEFGTHITHKHLEVLDDIQNITNQFYVTGSIALSLLGIIRRPIGDVDIVVWDKGVLKQIYETFGGEFFTNYNEQQETDLEDMSPKHLRFDFNGLGVCVFFMQYETTTEIEVEGRKLSISDPKWIISAKFNYIRDILTNTITDKCFARLLKNLGDIQDYIFYNDTKISIKQ